VPTVARRRQELPRALPEGHIERLLRSCDRNNPVGIRDFAILTVLARLGVRADEVAHLELNDIDWRAGEVRIRGKGPRVDKLPLPTDVAKPSLTISGAPVPTALSGASSSGHAPHGKVCHARRLVGWYVRRATVLARMSIWRFAGLSATSSPRTASLSASSLSGSTNSTRRSSPPTSHSPGRNAG
jgi:integrase/recombinase XerD